MLKKKNRLTKKEFADVFSVGDKKFSDHFLFIKVDKKDEIKISVAVSKKVEKLAVNRNASRRKIYNILQDNLEFFGDVNLIILITKPILNINKDKLEKEIKKI